jgi:hypothetical protein
MDIAMQLSIKKIYSHTCALQTMKQVEQMHTEG